MAEAKTNLSASITRYEKEVDDYEAKITSFVKELRDDDNNARALSHALLRVMIHQSALQDHQEETQFFIHIRRIIDECITHNHQLDRAMEAEQPAQLN